MLWNQSVLISNGWGKKSVVIQAEVETFKTARSTVVELESGKPNVIPDIALEPRWESSIPES